MIKTFRGSLADGGIVTVNLHTQSGTIGYRIKKFQIMPLAPGSVRQELVAQIFTVEQTTAVATVDFSDPTLLAACTYSQLEDSWTSGPQIAIFDDMVVNQDIYITLQDTQNNGGSNYYIELEQFKLDLNENTVATLKNIRNTTQ